MEIIGKIIAALPMRSGTTKEGKQWTNATYVVETIEQYPKKMAFDVMNDRIQQFNIQIGETISVSFDINAHEYEGKWFNSIRAYNVNRNLAQAQPTQVQYQGYAQPIQPQYYQQPIQQGYVQQGYAQPIQNQYPQGFSTQQELPFPPPQR